MTADERERAYHDVPTVTPEREKAWQQWKDDYVVACADQWIADGATDRSKIIEAGAAVLCDLARLDDMPWMSMGEAFAARIGALILGSDGELAEPERTEFLRSLRTIETATPNEQTLALAYQMGITVQQAAKLQDASRRDRHREPEKLGRTALYRHFDENGALLYVGIAKDPGKRGEQHGYHSKWYRFVADTQTEWFDTREQAAAAERSAILHESPIFNQTHNKANRAAAVEYLFGALEGAGATTAQIARQGGAA